MGSSVLVVAAGWCAGIVAGAVLALPSMVLLVGTAATALVAAIAPSAAWRLLALALAACLVGGARAGVGDLSSAPDPLAVHAGDVALRGRLVEAPAPRGGRFEAVVEVDGVAGSDAPGGLTPIDDRRPRVLLRASYLRAGYGDRVEITGRLSRPRSRPGWPLEQMLARRQIRWVVDAGPVRVIEPAGTSVVGLLTAARGHFEANTRAILPEPHASLVAGIVFGSRVGLPAELRAAMSTTGTSHLTAVSGANVAMVAGSLIFVAAGLVGRLPASAIAIVGVWLYALLVGAPPSAMRAAAMATVALAARGLGRQADATVGLALAVSVLLAWDPGLAFDLGFQLSATATAGLILLSPRIEQWLSWLPGWARGYVAVAVAAQLATLPLIVGTFQRISLVSLPANVLAAPTIPTIMGLGVLVATLGGIPGFDAVLGWSAWLATSALLTVIETAAQLPGGVVAVGRSPAWLPALWYVVLLCWVGRGSADVKALGLSPSALTAGALLGAGVLGTLALVGWPWWGRTLGVQIVLLDTEPASAFVRTPEGRTAVLLTSAAPRGIAASVGAHLDLSESTVDVEVAPGGVRTGVSLLEVGAGPGSDVRFPTSDSELGRPSTQTDTDGSSDLAATLQSTSTSVGPEARIGLGDGLEVQVVDVRLAGDQPVMDVAVLAGNVAILLPGPGTPSTRWPDVVPNAVSIAMLPSSAVSWARSLPPRNWLLVVGERPVERDRDESSVPFLSRRDHGSIDVTVHDEVVDIRVERCSGGSDCRVEVPVPAIRTLISAGIGDDASPDLLSQVQSGRISHGERSTWSRPARGTGQPVVD
jgi:competence protein ComEC